MNIEMWRGRGLPTRPKEISWAEDTKTFPTQNRKTPTLNQVRPYVEQVWSVMVSKFFIDKHRYTSIRDSDNERDTYTRFSLSIFDESTARLRELMLIDEASKRIEKANSFPLTTSLSRLYDVVTDSFSLGKTAGSSRTAGKRFEEIFLTILGQPEKAVEECFHQYARQIFRQQDKYNSNRRSLPIGLLPPTTGARLRSTTPRRFRD